VQTTLCKLHHRFPLSQTSWRKTEFLVGRFTKEFRPKCELLICFILSAILTEELGSMNAVSGKENGGGEYYVAVDSRLPDEPRVNFKPSWRPLVECIVGWRFQCQGAYCAVARVK
jgi:hypothetical protein